MSRTATSVAREAIEDWLRQRKRLAVREEIAEYAGMVAGSNDDLAPHVEVSAVSHLLGKRKKASRR
jgi:hypothetical protein